VHHGEKQAVKREEARQLYLPGRRMIRYGDEDNLIPSWLIVRHFRNKQTGNPARNAKKKGGKFKNSIARKLNNK
jgi:hypothetical protein